MLYYDVDVNADIELTVGVNQISFDHSIGFESAKISNVKVVNIETDERTYTNYLPMLVESNTYMKFFKENNIETLKNGTSIDSLSKNDLFDLIKNSPNYSDKNIDTTYSDLFDRLPEVVNTLDYCESYIREKINGSLIASLFNEYEAASTAFHLEVGEDYDDSDINTENNAADEFYVEN